MKMTLSTTFSKYALLTTNILISLLCLAFISSGVVALGGIGSVMGAYTITLFGFLILAVCFIGCCAALRESYILSMTFVVTVAAAIILQILFMITFSILKDTFLEMGIERIGDLWELEMEQSGAMDKIQSQYSCCGKDSPQDYIQDDGKNIMPISCCLQEDCSDLQNKFVTGCTGSITEFFDDQGDNLILISLGLIGIEILSLVSAYFLGKSVEHRVQKSDQIVISE